MPFTSGTANDHNALFTQLNTFAVNNGWTSDRLLSSAGEPANSQSGQLFLSKGGVFVGFAWNQSLGDGVGMYQATGFAGGTTVPDQMPGALGFGPTGHPNTGWNAFGTTVTRNRFLRAMNFGPFNYFFFSATDAVDEQYIHCTVEIAPGEYRHFGFGELEKSWTWTGGEYAYSAPPQQFTSGLYSSIDALISGLTTTTSTGREAADSMRLEGMPGQGAGGKYGTTNAWGSATAFSDTDGDPLAFIHGTGGQGKISCNFLNLPSNSGDGFLPLVPNAVFYRDVTPTPDRDYLLGFQKDVRLLNMKNFNPQDTFTVGADTWQVFPAILKQAVGGSARESANLGIAYKQFA